MSNGGELKVHKVGEWSHPRPPTSVDQAILDKVKFQYEIRAGLNSGEFLAVLVRTQLVSGTNYLFKVYIGERTYSHLNVHAPLPCTNEGPVLVDYQQNKTMDDELEVF
ncbi:cystatin-A-like [Rana temporaria]|uniref:cystatin-A-like n=1 Tax=Rana temporaria TaxID=8407 RepID=UPI001AACB1A1|nr:cystatin-A-like [Rana temporaria]